MEYSKEVIEAARVVLEALGYKGNAPKLGEEFEAAIPAHLMYLAFLDPKEDKPGLVPQDLMDLWNERADARMPRCRIMSAARRRHAAARLREFSDPKDWAAFMEHLNHDPWALGETNNPSYPGWTADFDFFIRPASILRFVEKKMRPNRKKSAPDAPRDSYRDQLDRR